MLDSKIEIEIDVYNKLKDIGIYFLPKYKHYILGIIKKELSRGDIVERFKSKKINIKLLYLPIFEIIYFIFYLYNNEEYFIDTNFIAVISMFINMLLIFSIVGTISINSGWYNYVLEIKRGMYTLKFININPTDIYNDSYIYTDYIFYIFIFNIFKFIIYLSNLVIIIYFLYILF